MTDVMWIVIIAVAVLLTALITAVITIQYEKKSTASTIGNAQRRRREVLSMMH